MHRESGAVERFAVKLHIKSRRGDREVDKGMAAQAGPAFGPAVSLEVATRGVRRDSKFAKLPTDQI